MDSPTDVIDAIVDNLVDCGIIWDDDRTNAFLSIENTLSTAKEDFGVELSFPKE